MIEIDFNPKNQKLVMKGPMWLVDVLRSFPSRRFEPKSKAWLIPLTKQNVSHLQALEGVQTRVTDGAAAAIADLEKITARPVMEPLPAKWWEDKKYHPLEHQGSMINRGWSLKGYALFAAMGTGKTFVTVNTAMARHAYCGLRSLFVICPATLQRTWEKEFAKWADKDKFTTRRLRTGDKGTGDWFAEGRHKLHVVTVSVEGLGISEKFYDALCGAVALAKAQGPSMGVVDESSRIKNPSAVRTKRALEVAPHFDWRMILNGTPIAKGIQDLWSQYEFIDPNIIGSGDYWAFKTRYIVMGGYENKQIVGYSHTDELMQLIAPYSTEVNKDILKLPPKLYKTIHVEPTAQQKQLFKRILTGLDIPGGNYISVQNVLERMLRLQQVIGGFEPRTDPETEETTTVPLPENPKLEALLQVVEDNYVGSKFIVWARYIPEIRVLVEALRRKYGHEAVVDYYGETDSEQRALAESRYCSDPACRILVGNPAAAGLGLTFISGENDVMVYYSGTFAYIDRAQSEDRAHRIGQRNSCPIIDLVMEGSIDESIQAAIAQKTDLDTFVKNAIAAQCVLPGM